ncbi:AAA family ATPase [Embleya sp. AB8]|uniref:AAA family ATPase n=1 Tax=Embleya sp. AB8 TaxID=3156304 RepID=UPI003C730861
MTSAGDIDPYPSPSSPEGGASAAFGHVGFAPGADAAPSLWERYRADVIAFAVVVGACLVAGTIVGVVWEQIAPRVPLIATKDGVFQTAPETESSIALDGWFAVCGVVAGIVLAPPAFWRFRRQGVATALALTVGGLAGSYLAFKIGVQLGPDGIAEQVRRVGLGKRFDQPLDIQAKGVLMLWPIASMVIFLGLSAGFAPADREPVAGPGSVAGPGPGPGSAFGGSEGWPSERGAPRVDLTKHEG